MLFFVEIMFLCVDFCWKMSIFVDVIGHLDGLITVFQKFSFVFCLMNTAHHHLDKEE